MNRVPQIRFENSHRSGYSPAGLSFKFNDFMKRKGFWKFNKVRKNTIVQGYNHGGRKWLISFIKSLKATRIKRLINKETKWIKLLESTLKISINKIWQRGRDYSYS